MTKSGRKGFSLIELLVTLFLAGLILTLGVRLLQEVQIVFLDGQRMAPEPIARLSEALIRADVQSAIGVVRDQDPSSDLGLKWETGPLRLAAADGRVIQYDSELDELVRSVTSPVETDSGRRTILRRVSSWRWRQWPGGVVEIGLVHSRPRDPGSRISGSRAILRNSETQTERLFLRYAMRARPRRGSW